MIVLWKKKEEEGFYLVVHKQKKLMVNASL